MVVDGIEIWQLFLLRRHLARLRLIHRDGSLTQQYSTHNPQYKRNCQEQYDFKI